MKLNQLEQIKKYSTIVVDTGDFNQISKFNPQDSTTNPSLILKAVQKEEYKYLLNKVLKEYKNQNINEILDRLLIQFAFEILNIIDGRVSIEVDSRISFNIYELIKRSKQLVLIAKNLGINQDKILIKIAATWEGIQAAKILEQEGIKTNLTLIFSLIQAVACSDNKVQLISPFVGRVYDWYKKQNDLNNNNLNIEFGNENDKGVNLIKNIFNYYKYFGIKTEVMAASFRDIKQIISLTGCDLLTISPELLNQLQNNNENIQKLNFDNLNLIKANNKKNIKKIICDETNFRYLLNENQMATEKLSEGIRLFNNDINQLEKLIKEHL